MKKIAHTFDHAGRATANQDHLERLLEETRAENERLRRVILLQERRWRESYPPSPAVTRH